MGVVIKQMPASVENERAVLGACMADSDAAVGILGVLDTYDFQSTAHRTIYDAIKALHGAGTAIDLTTVVARLREKNKIESVGGAAYIAGLVTALPTAANASSYAAVVKSKAVARRLMVALHDGLRELEGGEPPARVVDRLTDMMHELEPTGKAIAVRLSDVTQPAITRMEEQIKHGGVMGLPTGFRDLDVLLSGLHQGELVTLAAQTSVGKSSLARQLAVNVAVKGYKVILFSLEMSVELITELILCMHAEVNLHGIRTGKLADKQKQIDKLVYAASKLDDAALYLDDESTTVQQVCSRARAHAMRHGLDLVIVDYLQLVEGEKGGSREREVASISRALKMLSRDINVPVVALSQFNRRVDQHNGSPRLSDLRESGAIEQDSDVVIFLERVKASVDVKHTGNARLTIKKQRNGPPGTVPLVFRSQFTRFENATKQDGGQNDG